MTISFTSFSYLPSIAAFLVGIFVMYAWVAYHKRNKINKTKSMIHVTNCFFFSLKDNCKYDRKLSKILQRNTRLFYAIVFSNWKYYNSILEIELKKIHTNINTCFFLLKHDLTETQEHRKNIASLRLGKNEK